MAAMVAPEASTFYIGMISMKTEIITEAAAAAAVQAAAKEVLPATSALVAQAAVAEAAVPQEPFNIHFGDLVSIK